MVDLKFCIFLFDVSGIIHVVIVCTLYGDFVCHAKLEVLTEVTVFTTQCYASMLCAVAVHLFVRLSVTSREFYQNWRIMQTMYNSTGTQCLSHCLSLYSCY